MRSLRFASVLAPSVLALSLLLGGDARADIAPPPDGGSSTVDMATTQAQPDMSVPKETEEDGCSMAQHGQPLGLPIALGVSVLTLLLARRRRLA